MSGFQIMLLVIGAAIFVASFILPDMMSGKEDDPIDVEEKREEIRRIIDSEMKNAEGRLQDVVDETVNYAVEKSERSLEKVSNEKINAVSEFSETVLTDIHKSHEDAMFLYDMLHDKQKNLHETVIEADKSNAKAIEAKNELEYAAKQIEESLSANMESAPVASPAPVVAPAPVPAFAAVDKINASTTEAEIDELLNSALKESGTPEASFDADAFLGSAKSAGENVTGRVIEHTTAKPESVMPVANSAAPNANMTNAAPVMPVVNSIDGGGNNNERILELHKQGRSNMAIAKELGLGVGEVNLVIDLFEVM